MQALTGNHVGPTTAAAALEEMFSSGGGGGRAGTSKRVTVLLVDEMDLLVTKKQTVITRNAWLYNTMCEVARRMLQDRLICSVSINSHLNSTVLAW